MGFFGELNNYSPVFSFIVSEGVWFIDIKSVGIPKLAVIL